MKIAHLIPFLLLSLFALMMDYVLCVARAENNVIHYTRVFDAEAIGAGASATSAPISLESYRPHGYFAAQLRVSGGTATSTLSRLRYEVSNDGATFITPSAATDIFTDQGTNSGPTSNGCNVASFTPPVSRFIRFIGQCTGNVVTVTCDVVIQ